MTDFDIVYVTDNNDKSIDILQQTYTNVHVVYQSKDAILAVLERRELPMIMLIDVDTHFALFEKVCQSLIYDNTSTLFPIACSKVNTSMKYKTMGALDFILKPFSEPVLKTLFLNIYRHKSHLTSKKNQSIAAKFQGRLKVTYSIAHHNNHWFSETQYTHHKSIENKQYLSKLVNSWNFAALSLSQNELIQCVYIIFNQVFEQFPTLKSLQMKQEDMYDFIFDICNSYHNSNPYHNFRHAVDVLQSTWYYLSALGFTSGCRDVYNNNRLQSLLEPVHILALLLASLGHDVGHPGVNNGFMVATATPLAALYNDKSVLECYHSMAYFNLLCKHYYKSNIDIKSHPDYEEFRKVIVQSILSTDMGCHQDYVQKTRLQIERLRNDALDISNKALQENERMIICSTIMKCADISNCARPFETAKSWALVLAEEFFQQGDLEKELGLASIAINERGKVSLADFQLGFMLNVACEMFSLMGDLFPQLRFCSETIHENIDKWKVYK